MMNQWNLSLLAEQMGSMATEAEADQFAFYLESFGYRFNGQEIRWRKEITAISDDRFTELLNDFYGTEESK